MKKNKVHMAVVLDEYGALEGIVTLEDLIETLLGERDDEYDTVEDKNIVKVSDNEYIVNGAVQISEVNDVLEIDLNSEDCDSIGGYCINLLNRFPNENESIEDDDNIYIINEIENKSIKKIHIIIGKK